MKFASALIIATATAVTLDHPVEAPVAAPMQVAAPVVEEPVQEEAAAPTVEEAIEVEAIAAEVMMSRLPA